MTSVIPQRALVRPRARLRAGEPSSPLDELLEEYQQTRPTGVVWIDGPAGSGKSTALAHLAARFEGDPRFCFLDDAAPQEIQLLRDVTLAIATGQNLEADAQARLWLEPWGFDELLEYLLATHRDECNSVVKRLGTQAHRQWWPDVASVVLDRMAMSSQVCDVESAVLAHLAETLGTNEQLLLAKQVSLARQLNKHVEAQLVLSNANPGLPAEITKLLRHELVQLPLAAEQITDLIGTRSLVSTLEQRFSRGLVKAVANRVSGNSVKLNSLLSHFKSCFSSRSQPMIASILHAADPSWRPNHGPMARMHLNRGYFAHAQWQGIQAAGADLSGSDLRSACLKNAFLANAILLETTLCRADLRSANMENVAAAKADFQEADMCDANLRRARLCHARFYQAMLRNCVLAGADLTEADLENADLSNADLSQAHLLRANITGCDLSGANLHGIDGRALDFRTTTLNEARADQAVLCQANLEDVTWRNASLQDTDLSFAHLTGSKILGGNLRRARLTQSELGEIDWEGADLREANLAGATFHMGSSRSGLVGSPYASEGTRTGFYTDDLEELYFKRPEEIRKANLRGADLRGANIKHVDFYLVDLRDAKLDAAQLRQARQTGAILSDE